MKRLLLLFYVVLLSNYSLAVNLIINPSPTAKAYCPNVSITYSVTNSSGGTLPNCTYTWTVNGGTILGQSTGTNLTSISVKWNDMTGSGTLTVTTSGCTPSGENGSTKTTSYVRHSVFNRPWPTGGVCNTATTQVVPLCNPGVITLCVDPMYIEGTGGSGPPQKEVDRYIFNIPAGWRANGTTNGPAPLSISSRSITLQPLAGTNGEATVTVVGSVQNSCGGTLNSPPFDIKIKRQVIFVNPPQGFTGLTCALKTPIVFSVTPLACATSYSWTYPANWGGSSTTNQITLTPPGDGGATITATATLSGGGTVSASYKVDYSPTVPYPSPSSTAAGTYEWCNYETFTFTATPPPGYPTNFGMDWYAAGGILINGVAATVGNTLHTTTNSVTVTIPGSTYGNHTVGVWMNNNVCPRSLSVGYTKKVGPYSNDDFSIVGPSTICPNQVADFRPFYITPDILGYQWSAPSSWSSSGQGTPYFHVSVPSPFYGDVITLRLQNRCGWTNTPEVLYISPSGGCGFSFALSPNPASTTLTVSELDEEKGSAITLKDKTSKTVREVKTKKPKVEIDVSDLPSDPYVLIVTQRGRTESQHIVINH